MKYIQYPKLCTLLCSFVAAYVLFQTGFFDELPSLVHGHGYISMFIGGLLFSFGFTTPFAIAIFIEMSDLVHPVPGALAAGMGALLSDITIFEFIRCSFEDELHRLKKTAIARWLHDKLHHETIPERTRQYVMMSIAGLIIASPLPDEFGVSLLSGLTEIRNKTFALISFALNTIGVFAMLLIGRAFII